MTVAIVTSGCNQTADSKVGSDIKSTAQDTATATKDAFSTGKDKAVELATNTAAAVVKIVIPVANDPTQTIARIAAVLTKGQIFENYFVLCEKTAKS